MRPLGWVQESVLRVLREGPRTVRDIYDATEITPRTIRDACTALERRGLVRVAGLRRRPCTRAARIYQLTTTRGTP